MALNRLHLSEPLTSSRRTTVRPSFRGCSSGNIGDFTGNRTMTSVSRGPFLLGALFSPQPAKKDRRQCCQVDEPT